VCEKKHRKGAYPAPERNWCWIGLKRVCHTHLKDYKPWAALQEMGFKAGTVPPSDTATSFSPIEHPELCDRPELGEPGPWSETDWQEANKWFAKNVRVYVLNLASDTDRWEMISHRLGELNINATRVLGVDMRQAGTFEQAKSKEWVPWDFSFEQAQKAAATWKYKMGNIAGTVGCASAHFKAQAQVLADGSPLAVVLEDDSWLETDFVLRLWKLVNEELPCDWDVVSLMSRCGYGRCVSQHLMRVQPDVNEPEWRCHQGVNFGMHGILYHTERLPYVQHRWKRAVFDEKRPHCLDVDVALASISDEVGFYAVPSCQKPGFLREKNLGSARWDINQDADMIVTEDAPAAEDAAAGAAAEDAELIAPPEDAAA
jgi:GR25 family glycosyltransferase involved in LPS biosynthesis